ncbi:MAG TPA: hypothetical protein PKZ21_03045 [Bacteroidales bacterium]|nr:hypothetical protein [Bacteroidales bacterium]
MKKIIVIIAFVGIFVSCSKENRYERRLIGTWKIVHIDFTSATDTSKSFVAENAGGVQFLPDGTGKNDYSYKNNAVTYVVKDPFTWSNENNDKVLITSYNGLGYTTNEWNVEENSRNSQILRNVASDGDVTIWKLERFK